MRILLTAAAVADIEHVGDYIAKDNPERAVSYITALEHRIAQFGTLPQGGRLRPEWGALVRSTPFGSHLIVWRTAGDTVEILRVVHGSRDLTALFRKEPLE